MGFTIIEETPSRPATARQGGFTLIDEPTPEKSWLERESQDLATRIAIAKGEQPPEAPGMIAGMAREGALPMAVSLAASQAIKGVGFLPTLVKAGIDVAGEGINQATGLSPRSNWALAGAALPGPVVEGARAAYQGTRRFVGHHWPGAANLLKEEAEEKALKAAEPLYPPIPSKQLYGEVDAAGQGVEVAFPRTIKHVEEAEKRVRLDPPPETTKFFAGVKEKLQTQATEHLPRFPRGISIDDAQRIMSDLGDDIRMAKRNDNNKLASDLTEHRAAMGADFDQLGNLSKAHKAASRAFRQEQGAKEVHSIIENATRSGGGIDRTNVDQIINAINKTARDDSFFKGSFDPGKLEALDAELRDLAKDIKKYSKTGELLFSGAVGGSLGYALGDQFNMGGLGATLGATAGNRAISELVANVIATPKGRKFLSYLTKQGGGEISVPLLKAFLQGGRAGLVGHEQEPLPSSPQEFNRRYGPAR